MFFQNKNIKKVQFLYIPQWRNWQTHQPKKLFFLSSNLSWGTHTDMVELADTTVLNTVFLEGYEGSSPSIGTKYMPQWCNWQT